MKSTGRRVIAAILAMALVMALPAATAEAQGGTTFTVRVTDDTVDANPGDGICADTNGDCSLRAAVQEANASPGTDTVKLQPETAYSLTITGSGEDAAATGDLDITDDIVIRGRGATITLRMLFDRGLDVMAEVTADIDRLEIRDGRPAAGESGGAIRSAGTLNLDYFEASFNSAGGTDVAGGALFNDGGELFIKRSTLELNSTGGSGGAIAADGGFTAVLRTTMRNNVARTGGALHLAGAAFLDIDRSDFLSNEALTEGGGLWNSADGTMFISRTNIRNNDAFGMNADNGGGGVFNDGGMLTVERSRVLNNTASLGEGSGGGLFNNEGTMLITESVVRFNEAARAGGGIEVVNGKTAVEYSRILTNTTGEAPGNGGGLHASGSAAEVGIYESFVNRNTAANDGGGLWAAGGDSSMTLMYTSVSRNEANGIADGNGGGGGLFNNGGLLDVSRTVIAKNEAVRRAGSGGGILNLGTLVVVKSEISKNQSSRTGGGISSNDIAGGGNATLTDVDVLQNSAVSVIGEGGGIHVTGSSITTVISDSNIMFNNATTEGGGLWNEEGATMTVTTTTISDNTAPVGPNVFQQGEGGDFTIDGLLVPPTLS